MRFSILRDHGRRVKEIDERLVHVASVRLITLLIIHGARSGKMLGGDKTSLIRCSTCIAVTTSTFNMLVVRPIMRHNIMREGFANSNQRTTPYHH